MKIIYVFIILLFYNLFEIAVFKINFINLKSNKLNRQYKFTQISDYHNNKLINKKRLIRNIKKFNPDAIFLTGDIISRTTIDFANVENLISSLSKYKIYFVQGNHELDNEREDLFYKILEKYSVENISSKNSEFNEDIRIYGNSFGINNKCEFQLNEKFYNILLTHDPKEFIDYKENYDLVLSGHKHGGQIRLPILGQIVDHNNVFFPKYSKGMYKVNNTDFYIDSGLGQSVPIRLLNRVQITNISIK